MPEVKIAAPQAPVPKKTLQERSNGKSAPLPAFAILPIADNIVDVVSGKTDKASRSTYFLEDLKKKKEKAESDLKDAKKSAPDKVEELKREAIFFTAVHAHINNLTASFESLQSRWHSQVDEITDYANQKIKAGNIFVWIKKWAPWVSGPVVGAGASYTGAWKEILDLVTKIAPQYPGIMHAAAYVAGGLAVIGISWGINKLAVVLQHRAELKKQKLLDDLFKEEGTVRMAIEHIIQQLMLAISAEARYDNELVRCSDEEQMKNAQEGNLEQIWGTFNRRIAIIRQRLAEPIRDLFPASLELPDYIDSKTNGNGGQKAPAAETQPQPPST